MLPSLACTPCRRDGRWCRNSHRPGPAGRFILFIRWQRRSCRAADARGAGDVASRPRIPNQRTNALTPELSNFLALCEVNHVRYSGWGLRVVGDLDQTEVNMPTVKQLGVIAIAIALALVGATAVGISAIQHSATKVSTGRATPATADFRLNDHQRLRRIFELPPKLRGVEKERSPQVSHAKALLCALDQGGNRHSSQI